MIRALSTVLVVVAAAASATASAGDAPLLWRAERGEGEVLWLFGSIDSRRSAVAGLDSAIERAYASADALTVLLDLAREDRAALNDRLVALAFLGDGATLRERVSETTYAEVRLALEALRRPPASLDAFEPWFVGIFLAARMRSLLGYRAEYGLTAHFLERARGAKEIVSLESPEQNLDLRTGLPPELQALMLEKTLRHLDVKRLERIERAWDEGDAETLEALLFEDLHADPNTAPYFEQVVFERSRRLAARLEELASGGRTWFAVLPLAHLLGPRSIPALLSERGYRVERVGSARGAEDPER
jgi:uncharacterized protein YbaP (TraB family)